MTPSGIQYRLLILLLAALVFLIGRSLKHSGNNTFPADAATLDSVASDLKP